MPGKSRQVEPESPHGLRELIRFYLLDVKTPLGKIIDILIILLNLLVCFLFVLDTYPISAQAARVIWILEITAVVIFALEYAARVYGSRNRLRQILDIYSIIDLVAILPTVFLLSLNFFGVGYNFRVINTIRVIRVFRIFRFLRFLADEEFFFGRLNQSLFKLARLIMTIMIIFFVSSGFFYHVEHSANEAVHNFGDAFYFTVVTLTTVGYGDIIPVSEAGRWVTVLMILSGIILIPWQAGEVVREWIHLSAKTDVICPNCGLHYHDRDASHCKACGHVIYQEFEGE